MKRFEYCALYPPSDDFGYFSANDLCEWLNNQGKDGWELITNNGGLFIFKREVSYGG